MILKLDAVSRKRLSRQRHAHLKVPQYRKTRKATGNSRYPWRRAWLPQPMTSSRSLQTASDAGTRRTQDRQYQNDGEEEIDFCFLPCAGLAFTVRSRLGAQANGSEVAPFKIEGDSVVVRGCKASCGGQLAEGRLSSLLTKTNRESSPDSRWRNAERRTATRKAVILPWLIQVPLRGVRKCMPS